MAFDDLTGEVFARLTVLRQAESKGWQRRWLLLCSCGQEATATTASLRSGNTKSCGCLKREAASENMRRERARSAPLGHCLSYTPEYRAWQTMRLRCLVSTNPAFKDYGGRGITVCARWRDDVKSFVSDVGSKPSPRHEIDRADNDGGYWCGRAECPDCGPIGRVCNVRWATRSQNCRNRRSNKRITYRGETKAMAQWAEELGLNTAAVDKRLAAGWSVERAFETPVRHISPKGCGRYSRAPGASP